MGSINYANAIRPDTAYIKKIIENSLLCEWAIRIEYECSESGSTCWQCWDKAFFAIRSAEAVVKALMDCFSKYPYSAIRINAEKFRPQTSVLYTVYNPRYLAAETEIKTQAISRQHQRELEQISSQLGLRT